MKCTNTVYGEERGVFLVNLAVRTAKTRAGPKFKAVSTGVKLYVACLLYYLVSAHV
jgi:hypothetical protein